MSHDGRLTVVRPSFDCRSKLLKLVTVFALLLTLGVGNAWGAAAVGTTIYAEDFSGYSANGVPSGSITNSHTGTTVYSGTLTYSVTDGSGTTKVYTENSAGGTSPELLVAKGSGTFSIEGIPNGGATALTLTYKQNAQSLTVSVSGTGYSIASSGNSTAGSHSTTITVGSASTFTLTFTGPSGTKNVRLDDITITVKTAAVATPYTVTFYKTDGSTQAITEASVGAGVMPPSMDTPCDGWAFQGWSKSQSTSSTSTTVLTTETLTDGKYYPSANTTLYPVYTKTGTASTDLTIVPGSYASKGTGNYGSGAERTASVDGVNFGAHYITGNAANSPASGKSAGTYIQCQASNANIYNKSAFPGSITKVVVNQYAAQAFSLYCGSSQLMASNNTSTGQTPSGTAQSAQTSATQMTWNVSAASSYTYFDIKKGSGTSYISSIVITYLAPVTYYYSYPTCCTNLGSINGSIFLTKGKSLVRTFI